MRSRARDDSIAGQGLVVLVEGQQAAPARAASGASPIIRFAASSSAPTWRGCAGPRHFSATARLSVAAEVAAQFGAFRATGLALDHVNAHEHFHLHPTIARTIISIGRDHRSPAGSRSNRSPCCGKSNPRHGAARTRWSRLGRGCSPTRRGGPDCRRPMPCSGSPGRERWLASARWPRAPAGRA